MIHAAIDSSVSQHPHDPLRMVDTIVTGTRNVLEFARASGMDEVILGYLFRTRAVNPWASSETALVL